MVHLDEIARHAVDGTKVQTLGVNLCQRAKCRFILTSTLIFANLKLLLGLGLSMHGTNTALSNPGEQTQNTQNDITIATCKQTDRQTDRLTNYTI